MKFIIYLLLLTFLSCSGLKSARPKAVKGILDLTHWNFEKDGILDLNGEWEFFPGEFVPPADFSPMQRGIQAIYINVPIEWNNVIVKEKPMGAKGFATYYLKIILPAGNHPSGSLGLKTSYTNDSFDLYVNEKIIINTGKISKTEENSEMQYKIELVELNKETVSSQEKGNRILNLVIHVSNYSHRSGGILNSFRFGDLKSLITKDRWNYIFDFFLFGSIFIMGIYHFGLYYLRRNDSSPLWFGIFCILICLRIVIVGEKYIELMFPGYSKLFIFIEYADLISLPSVFTNFLYYLFSEEFNKNIKKWINWTGFLLIFPVLLLPAFYYTHLLIFIQVYILISGMYGLYVLFHTSHKNIQGAKSLLAGFIFFFSIVIHDILFARQIIQSVHLAPLGLFGFIFSQAYVLSMRFSNAFKESEEQRRLLVQAKLEIENLSRTKDQFLANLSHEIKTPLSIVFAYSQMLPAQKENPKKIEKYSDQIFANASKLNDYVSDLILVTDLETNLELQKTDAEINNIIKDCISNVSELAAEKSIQLEYTESSSENLYCDALLIKKAILAVLKNAIVYNRAEGKASISSFMDQKDIKIIIQDTGIGIEQSMKERIFDKFFRADSSLTYEVSGVGIGLFLAKKIIELHKGRIEVRSELGIGSEFTLTLPTIEKDRVEE